MLYEGKSHYRPASSSSAVREDGMCANDQAGMYVVCDGVSGPYSPNNPKTMYGRLTGGQMVSTTINHVVEGASANQTLQHLLSLTNRIVGVRHFWENQDPMKKAVAGACVAACKVNPDAVTLALVGDCFAFWRDSRGVNSLTNFDQAADAFEKKGDEAFQKCLTEADTAFPETKGKNIGKAWDSYFPYFCQKQFLRANRNLGNGGHAMLNGDPAMTNCWTVKEIPLEGLRWILLCTDGMLPPHLTCPANHRDLAEGIGNAYAQGDIYAIEHWRDKAVAEHEAETKGSDMPHIEGHPEGSVIALKFSE